MEDHNQTAGQPAGTPKNGVSGEETIKVVDRKGNVKVIPRSEYDRKKRRRKRHERSKNIPVQDILTVVFILAVIIAASYIALRIIQ